MRRALVFGAFDVIHPGHRDFLTQARAFADRLVASVARDGFVVERKGHAPVRDEERRLRDVLETGLVDEAYLGDAVPGTYAIVRRAEPDVICLGYDQDDFKEDLLRWLKAHGKEIEVVTLRPFKPEIYKSSKLNASSATRPT